LVDHWPNALIGAFIIGLALDFLLRFFFPALRVRRSLKRITNSLRNPETAYCQRTGDLHAMIGRARSDPVFSGLWLKYSKTLHAQSERDGRGEQSSFRWRSTILAETFFNQQALVDIPLRTEYFKHLPGILTGFGIIGTFAGLIRGLNHFDVSLKPEDVQAALDNLIKAVGQAFYVSATAIGLAIFFTLLEKFLLNRCYALVDIIQDAIDGLFHSGAGEEYLERLVKASETSATQSLQIKDALVADLKQILTEITVQQVSASARDSSQISTGVGKVIVESLGEPMTRLSDAVERVSSAHNEATRTSLLDVLAGFSEQMRELLGAQMKGMSALVMQTTQATQDSVGRFELLVSNMDAARGTVEEIKTLLTQGQQQTGEQLERMLSTICEHLTGANGELTQQARTSVERQQEETARLSEQAGTAVSGFSQEVENLLHQSLDSNRSLQSSIAALIAATGDSGNRMKSGADLIYAASRDFAQANEGVVASMNGSSGTIEQIHAAAHSLSSAMNGTIEVLNEYKSHREAFAMMVTDLKSTIQNARKEAFMTSDMVEKIQGAATQLGHAHKQSEDYLKGINEVLAKAHEAFAANIEKTLNRGNAQFHVELSTAVSLLSAGVQDLGDMFERVSAIR
jgi:methyl-accepting chemotaxis protein